MVADLRSSVIDIAQITDDGNDKEPPSNVGGTKIVWQGWGGTGDDWEIYGYFKYGSPLWYQFTDNDV